jgi:O-antigen/teichoic acid export membrane protein
VDRVRSIADGGRVILTLGLVADGIGSYLYLTSSGRALGPERFALISVMWAVLFLIGNGLFIPVEQELARSIASSHAQGDDGNGIVSRLATAAGVLVAVVAVIGIALSGTIRAALFRDQTGFVAALIVGVASIACMFLVRGVLAGTGRYAAYGALFMADAAAKAAPALGAAAAGVDEPLVYAWIMATSGFIGCLVALAVARPIGLRRGTGPATPWPPILSALGFLLLTSVLSLTVINIGTVAVEVLSGPTEEAAAGIFLSALVIARVPLFLFQAVQAIVLPRLSAKASVGDIHGFRADLRLLAGGLAGLTAVAVVGAFALGAFAQRVLFGDEFDRIDGRDMGLLTLASMLMTGALTLNQAQIALRRQHQTWWPWALALVAFVAVAATSTSDLLGRVEWAMCAAGAVALVVAAWLLRSELRRVPPGEAVAPEPQVGSI